MSNFPDTSSGIPARVVAAYGRFVRVRLQDGTESLARPSGRALQVVCGDIVRCEFDARHDELRVVSVGARLGMLHRSNARGAAELIATHLTRLVVVIAPIPEPDLFMVDRYLCAAECAGMGSLVLLNKAESECPAELTAALAVYAELGFQVQRTSTRTGVGMDELRAALHGHTSALVGQSGVGKSSLSRSLVPHSDASIGELLRDEEGRHTTTAVRLYDLPDGGAVIDSPGVRDFAPAIDRLDGATLGFREVAAFAAGCRFSDCRHMREPDCAVQAAVGASFDARRYESYRRLRRLFEQLQPGPGSRQRR